MMTENKSCVSTKRIALIFLRYNMDIITLNKSLSLLLETEKKIKKRTEKYIELCDSSLLFQFTNEDETKKLELSKLTSFTSKLVENIGSTDAYIAKISSYICISDNEMNNDMTLFLTTIFDKYTYWKSAAKAFILNTERLFKDNEKIKYSLLLSEAKVFDSATEAFCTAISDIINKIKI